MPLTPLDEIPGFLFRRLRQVAVSSFHRRFGALGVTPEQYTILRIVQAHPGIDQISIAARAALDASTTTDVIRRLTARGDIRRRVGRHDKRTRLVYLTRRGAKLLAAIEAIRKKAPGDEFAAALSAREQATLVRIARKLLAAHEQDMAGGETDRTATGAAGSPWRRHR